MAGLELIDIERHLDDLFQVLPHSARRADGAQRSLRATVGWSDALLQDDERRLLRRMGVFAGGFDLTAIEAVCADGGQTAAQVADLTARQDPVGDPDHRCTRPRIRDFEPYGAEGSERQTRSKF